MKKAVGTLLLVLGIVLFIPFFLSILIVAVMFTDGSIFPAGFFCGLLGVALVLIGGHLRKGLPIPPGPKK